MRTVRPTEIAAILVIAITSTARSQGFQVSEHGACAQGRAGTGAAESCRDGSGMWFNPATIAGQPGWTIGVGGLLIATTGGFTADFDGVQAELDNGVITVPHFYAQYGITEKLTVGFGLFIPYGLGTKWPLDTSLTAAQLDSARAFPGRFLGYDNDLRSIYLQPTVAYQINDKIAVGVGLDYVVGSVKLTQRVDLAGFEIPGGGGATFGSVGVPVNTDFANAQFDAENATGFGGHFGVWVAPMDRLRIGARYMTRVRLDYSGTVEFGVVNTGLVLPPQNPLSLALAAAGEPIDPALSLPVDVLIQFADLFSPGEPLADSTATTSITMPDQFILGVAFDVTPKLMALAEWQWAHWSVFDKVILDFDNDATPNITLQENFRNTNALRFGAQYALTPHWTFRGGYLWHQGASPPETVTPLLPEGARNEFTAGLGINISRMFSVDLAYQFITQDRRRGRVRNVPEGYTRQQVVDEVNSGLYTFSGHLLGTTVTVRF